uniref:Uncharacterized protein n=1 Tax=Acrobeloides nanus TaxID=290746 RepID=A0A914CYR2_9BILA
TRRNNSLPFAFPPIPKECLLQIPREHAYEPTMRSIRQRRSNPGDSIDEEDISETDSNEPASEERYDYRILVRPRSPTSNYTEDKGFLSYDIPEHTEQFEDDSLTCSEVTSMVQTSSENLLDSFDDTEQYIFGSQKITKIHFVAHPVLQAPVYFWGK